MRHLVPLKPSSIVSRVANGLKNETGATDTISDDMPEKQPEITTTSGACNLLQDC